MLSVAHGPDRVIAATDGEALHDAGRATAEIARAHPESEFERWTRGPFEARDLAATRLRMRWRSKKLDRPQRHGMMDAWMLPSNSCPTRPSH